MTAEVHPHTAMLDTSICHTPQMTESPQDSGESPPSIITLRMIMQGKEVGSIIGKKGDNVKRYREESGAKINITDASCPERIVTVTGSVEQIEKAFELICSKFEEIRETNSQANPNMPLPPISIRLIIPASQCGSLIGKGGTKIKEIREGTGASVQVASDMLPGSTERAVTISGPSSAINRCLHEICNIMLESPPKGATIPYRPKPIIQAPLVYAAAAGAAAQAAYSVPHLQALAATGNHSGQLLAQNSPVSHMNLAEQQRQTQQSPMTSSASTTNTTLVSPYSHPQLAQLQVSQGTPLVLPQPHNATYGTLINPALLAMGGLGYLNSYVAHPLNSSYLGGQSHTQSTEMVIPNELIGCIIGRGGAKINEIRQLSGAMIKISNCEEGTSDRKVTITGVPETITLAAYLINTSIELHKNQLLSTSDSPSVLTSSPTQQTAQQSIAATASMLPTASTASVTAAYTKPVSVNPYSTGSFGLAANPLVGMSALAPTASLAAYDPKTLLNLAKLKVLPSAGVIKQDHRFAPY